MTLAPDTLVYDSATVSAWQSNPDYNYNRELVTPDMDIIGLLSKWMNDLLRFIFSGRFADRYTEPVLIGVFVVLILVLLWFLYRKRPELFVRSRKVRLPYQVSQETIYGVDFRKGIEEALAREDYREAMRLFYLETLKQLSDEERIDWQLHKTPTEYIYELKGEALRPPFRQLTNRFLRVRYGNFEATRELFGEMQTFREEMKKGGGV